MRLFRLVALGAAGAVAYRLWKQRQPARAPVTTPEIDYGDATPPHGDVLPGSDTALATPEESTGTAGQSSRGFGEP
jgi:hypothetical protein